jgi:hypothetical protein
MVDGLINCASHQCTMHDLLNSITAMVFLSLIFATYSFESRHC